MKTFEGRVAVITGAGSGFGREFALKAARLGLQSLSADHRQGGWRRQEFGERRARLRWRDGHGGCTVAAKGAPEAIGALCRMSAEELALFGIDKLNVSRSEIPAVTHVDYSARIQTVHRDTNPLFHRLLARFKELTGCPVLVNTSFNVRGEPIVCTPEDAFRCFMGNELDVLVVGNCVLQKTEQDPALKQDYSEAFELD